jgi:hypothetical protein
MTGFNTVVTLSYYRDNQFGIAPPPYISPALNYQTAQPAMIGSTPYLSSLNPMKLLDTSRPNLQKYYELNGEIWMAEIYVENPFSIFGIASRVAYESSIA